MANTPYFTKAEAQAKNQQTFNEIKQVTEAISAGEGGKLYDTLSDAQALNPKPVDGTVFTVSKNDASNSGYYTFQSSKPGGTRFERSFADLDTYLTNSKNLLPQEVEVGKRMSGSGTIQDTGIDAINISFPVLLKPNTTYVFSGDYHPYSAGIRAALFNTPGETTNDGLVQFTEVTGGFSFTTGSEKLYFRIDLSTENFEFTGKAQLEEGSEVTEWEEYGHFITLGTVKGLSEELTTLNTGLGNSVQSDEIFELISKNLLDESKINFTKRYSPGSNSIVNRSSTFYALSPTIPVEEGEIYTMSNMEFGAGGYFVNEDDTNSVGDISTYDSVQGGGESFQVPVGQDIRFVKFNLHTTDVDSDILMYENPQLEEGELATEYEPYELVKRVKGSLLPKQSSSTSPVSDSDIYTALGNISYGEISDKIPEFRKHWISKDKDLVVVGIGTSLTARIIHSTDHPDAKLRPPLMHSNNFASRVWDKIKWEGQHYRRYDTGFFSESGSWVTNHNEDIWDDGPYRNGLTRFSDDTSAEIDFQIPVDAWQFNLIYRSDSLGTENAVVSITEGNGNVEVFNGTSWIEANGFVFSQKEAPANDVGNITYINPTTEQSETLSSYQTKGNTTYQKRLKMRCKSGSIDSRTVTKNVNISRTSGRLSYWGVEWSPREFMLTYVNAARGSHNSHINHEKSCLHFQDNEVWSFTPDLILAENPIHNSGGGNAPTNEKPSSYWGQTTEGFFFEDSGISLQSRANTLGINDLEWVIFNSSISWNFGAIADDGTLKLVEDADGRVLTALDTNMLTHLHLKESYPDVISINAIRNWVEAGIYLFGDMRTATEASGKGGSTFTNEGSHWNDTGSKVMARVVLPVFDFIV